MQAHITGRACGWFDEGRAPLRLRRVLVVKTGYTIIVKEKLSGEQVELLRKLEPRSDDYKGRD